MSAGFVLRHVGAAIATLAFVLAFNFFLFRVVDDNPVDNLFRGRNLSRSQIESLEERFGVGDPLIVQFLKYVRQTLQGDLGISIKSSRPVSDVIMDSFWPTVWLVGTATVASMVIGTLLGIRAAWKRGSRDRHRGDDVLDVHLLDARLLVGDGPVRRVRREPAVVPDGRLRGRRQHGDRVGRLPRSRPSHGPARADARPRLHRRVHDPDAGVDARHRTRGLPDARPGQGSAGRARAPPSRGPQRTPPPRQPLGAELRLRPLGRDRRRDDLLLAGPRPGDRATPSRAPTTRCCRACSCCSRWP